MPAEPSIDIRRVRIVTLALAWGLACVLTGGPTLAGQTSTAPTSIRLSDALAQLAADTELRLGYEASATDTVWLWRDETRDWTSLLAALEREGIRVDTTDGTSLLLAPPSPPDLPRITGQRVAEAPLRLAVTGTASDPLYAATALAADGRGWVADASGEIAVPRPPTGPTRVCVRHVGYHAAYVDLAGVAAGRPLAVRLDPDTFTTHLVEVVGRLPPRGSPDAAGGLGADMPVWERSPLGTRGLSAAAISQLGFSAVAGASAIDAASTRPALRGSASDETLLELDGLPVYYADHLFGLFPSVNASLASGITVYRTHYPSDWGGFRGGMLSVRSVEPAGSWASVDVGALASSATVTARSAGLQVLASGRVSYGDVAGTDVYDAAASQRAGEAVETGVDAVTVPDFSFWDGYLRAVYTRGVWTASAQAFGSRDAYALTTTQRTLLDATRRPLSLTGAYAEASGWRNAGFGVSLTRRLRRGEALTLRAYESRYDRDASAEADLTAQTMRGVQLGERQLLETALDNRLLDRQLALTYSRETSYGPNYRVGLQAQYLELAASFATLRVRPVDRLQADTRLHAFGELTLEPWAGGELLTGLRATYPTLSDAPWLSPRLLITQQLTRVPDLRVQAGYSYLRQAVRTLQQEDPYGRTYDVYVLRVRGEQEPAQAHNFTAGFGLDGASWSLHAEGYARWLPGLVANLSTTLGRDRETDVGLPNPSFVTVAGEAEVLGVDVDAALNVGGLSASGAYTLARSRQRFYDLPALGWQRAPDDRRHRTALTTAYEFGAWRVGLAYEGASGLVYTDVNALEAPTRREALEAPEFQRSLPAYHRVDASLARGFDVAGARLTVGLRCYNLADRANVSQRQYLVGFGADAAGPAEATVVGTDVGLLGRLLLWEAKLELGSRPERR